MNAEDTKKEAKSGQVERAIGMKMPSSLIDQIDEMAARQVRTRSNMLRVLVHLGMQAASEDDNFAAEVGIEVPAPGQRRAGRG